MRYGNAITKGLAEIVEAVHSRRMCWKYLFSSIVPSGASSVPTTALCANSNSRGMAHYPTEANERNVEIYTDSSFRFEYSFTSLGWTISCCDNTFRFQRLLFNHLVLCLPQRRTGRGDECPNPLSATPVDIDQLCVR